MRAFAHPGEVKTGSFKLTLPVVGLLAMYVPTYIDLYRGFWSTRDGSYGAVMFLVFAWLIWRERSSIKPIAHSGNVPIGWALFCLGLSFYIIGRSQSFYQLEVGSQIPLLLGLALLMLDGRDVKRLLFPILLLVFVIPVPGSFTDELLLPLKKLVSQVVDDTLHLAGYPVARNGVVLMIGPYTLLIADACSGLNSMVALSGVGLLYIHLARRMRTCRSRCLRISCVCSHWCL
jgi:exosortase